MIRQLAVTYKPGAATLTYAEMGDVVAESATDITITLPDPLANLWYRVSNVGAGVVTVYYGGAITTLKQTEQAMLLANGSASWWMSKGAGAMTKAEIEAVLTGVISSHTHILTGATAPTVSTEGFIGQFYLETVTPLLYQCTAYADLDYTWSEVGGGGTYTLPQATESTLGGIVAAAKTAGETSEVKIDTATGKLYSTPPTAATNGIPAGGTTGQTLKKDTSTDYDASWQDDSGNSPLTTKGDIFVYSAADARLPVGANGTVLTADSGETMGLKWVDIKKIYYALFDSGTSQSARTETGVTALFIASAAIPILGGSFYTTWSNGVTFSAKLWDSNKNLLVSKTYTGDGTTERKSILFDSPYDMTPLSTYYLSIERESGTIAKWYGATIALTAFVTCTQGYSGLPSGTLTTAGGAYDIGAILGF